jgi:hypothetical protein
MGKSPTDFLTYYGFHRRTRAIPRVCGLDYPFAVPRIDWGLGAARLVSTPSALLSLGGLARDCHLTGFPEFEQFYSLGFPKGTQFGLSPLRLPFRHARSAGNAHSGPLPQSQENLARIQAKADFLAGFEIRNTF